MAKHQHYFGLDIQKGTEYDIRHQLENVAGDLEEVLEDAQAQDLVEVTLHIEVHPEDEGEDEEEDEGNW